MSISKHITYPVPAQGPAPEPTRNVQHLEEVRYVKCLDCGNRALDTYCAYERCSRNSLTPTLAALACKGSMGFCCRHSEAFLP